jgi:hypothetical protein
MMEVLSEISTTTFPCSMSRWICRSTSSELRFKACTSSTPPRGFRHAVSSSEMRTIVAIGSSSLASLRSTSGSPEMTNLRCTADELAPRDEQRKFETAGIEAGRPGTERAAGR